MANTRHSPPTVYIGSFDGNVYALDAKDGSLRWSRSAGGQVVGSLSAIGDIVYVAEFTNNTTSGFMMKSGRRVFKYGRGTYSPVISDGHRLFLTGYSSLTALQPYKLNAPWPRPSSPLRRSGTGEGEGDGETEERGQGHGRGLVRGDHRPRRRDDSDCTRRGHLPGRDGMIAFRLIRPTPTPEVPTTGGIYTIRPGWEAPRQLTADAGDVPSAFSPSGRRLLFTRTEGDASGIYRSGPMARGSRG